MCNAPAVTYDLSQACQRWEKGWRSLSLSVNAIEDEHKLILMSEHTFQVRDQRTYIFASPCVCFYLSIDCLFLQALVDCCSRSLKQVSSRYAFFTAHNNVPSAESLEV